MTSLSFFAYFLYNLHIRDGGCFYSSNIDPGSIFHTFCIRIHDDCLIHTLYSFFGFLNHSCLHSCIRFSAYLLIDLAFCLLIVQKMIFHFLTYFFACHYCFSLETYFFRPCCLNLLFHFDVGYLSFFRYLNIFCIAVFCQNFCFQLDFGFVNLLYF